MLLMATMHFGCSGGGENYAGGGIGGTGVFVSSVGTVSGFGSVIVNDVTYATTDAEAFVENTSRGSGDVALGQNLSLGMVVRVEGRIDANGAATADRVFFENYLKGPVESITELDSLSREIVILGQRVLLDDRTIVRGVTASAVSIGMMLEVSGYVDESGLIATSYVEKIADSLPADRTVQLKGLVQSLNATARAFAIDSLAVDYALADLSALPGSSLKEGDFIRVTGALQTGSRVIAARLEPVSEFGTGAFDTVDLEGIITQIPSAGEFAVGRYTVRTDAATTYTKTTPEELARGTRVIVRGTFTDRSILADDIRLPEKIRLESNVASVSPFEKRLSMSGLDAVAVLTTATTRINGTAAGLEQIMPGDHVRIAGRRVANSEVIAATLLVTPSNETVNITGPVESAVQPTLVILGVPIDTGSIPADGFFGRDGKRVSAAEFFDSVKADGIVFAKGVLQSGRVIWKSVGFE
jgi:hypothetical protein